MGDRIYIAEIGILGVFGSCDLDFDPMTFIYKPDPYCLETHRMYRYQLSTFRLSKLRKLSDRQTDRQNRLEL